MPRSAKEFAADLHQREDSAYRRPILFLIGLSLVLSASMSVRMEIGGLLLQPILIPVIGLFCLSTIHRVQRLPPLPLVALTVFMATYFVVSLLHGLSLGSLAKAGMVWLIVVTVATTIETDDDARAATLGYSLGMAILAVVALIAESEGDVGVNPFSGVSNENAYSIYALPSMLLAGHFVLTKGTPKATRLILIVCVVAAGIGIFSTANRSGYVGVAFVALVLVARGRRLRDVLIIVLLGATLYGGFQLFGDKEVADQELSRSRSTEDKESGFDVRSSLFRSSIAIGLEHPVIGVGPQNVMLEMRARYYESYSLFEDVPEVAPHNVYGALFAGGGLVLVSATGFLGYALWSRPRPWRELGPPSPAEQQARTLLRAVLLLFLFRGVFTEDVLTTPPFSLAIGVALGMTVATYQAAVVERASNPAPPSPERVVSPFPQPRVRPRRVVVVDRWHRPEQPGGRT